MSNSDNDIVAAAQSLFPGVAWNVRAGVLEQAVDGTPRVQVPTISILQAKIDSLVQAKTTRVSLKEQARLDVKNILLTPTQRLQALLILLDFDQ